MATTPFVLLRRLPAIDARATDGELLRRYTETGDEAAFAELVQRNGPLVLRACRNVLRDPDDADDAFQATFIQLARHAAELTRAPSVAGWLHTVAVRSAGKIRRGAVRRRKREQTDREPLTTAPAEDAAWAELRERIDAELARLPEAYRLPLVLCYVQGLSYADAAQRLGCSLGTLRGRLERGREVLRGRLGRWGLPVVLVVAGAAPPLVGAGLRNATLAAIRSTGSTAARTAVAWVKRSIVVALAVATVAGIGFGALREPVEPVNPEPPAVPTAGAKGPAAERTDAAGDPLPPGAVARLGSSRFHHGSNIHRLTVSPDGKWIVSFGSHTGYRVWDAATGKEQVPVGMPTNARFTGARGLTGPVQWDAAIAPAGNRVVAVVPERGKSRTRMLDVTTGTEVASVPASFEHILTRPGVSSDRDPELSPDGKWILWTDTRSGNKTVYIADLSAKEPKPAVFAEAVGRNLWGLTFSGDGKSVMMHFDTSYEVWDRETRAVKLKVPVEPNGNWIGHAVISPDGKTLATVQPMAATFQLWDVATKKKLPASAEPFGNRVDVRCFSPDGKQVVGSNPSGPLRVWDVATGKKVRDYGGLAHGAWAAAFTPDGKRIAVARFDDVNILDVATGKPVHDFGGHVYSVGELSFTPDGRLLTCDGTALVWDPRTGRKLGGFRGPNGIDAITPSPDGKQIATTGADQKVRVWSAPALEELRVLDTKGFTGYTAAFAPDGKELAVGGDKPGIRVLDPAGARPPRVVAAGEVANWLQFTPDGRRVVFRRWSEKTKVHVWDVATDKEMFAFDAGKRSINRPALSADGRFLAAGDWDGHARVFDLATGKQVYAVDVNRRPDVSEHDTNTVYAVAFSPDGRTLATGDATGSVRVWELATGGERLRLDGHRGEVVALAFSPDGALLASGSGDRSAVVWDARGGSPTTDPKHQPKDAADAWARLTDRDAAVGLMAVRYLTDRPAEAAALFAKHLRPVAPADPKTVAGLIEKLASGDFAEREAAERDLAAVGEGATEQLRTALAGTESTEVRQRLTKLLAPLGGVGRAGGQLRTIRAVEALERAGTADARKLLREWANGGRGAELTEAARSALMRLGGGASVPR